MQTDGYLARYRARGIVPHFWALTIMKLTGRDGSFCEPFTNMTGLKMPISLHIQRNTHQIIPSCMSS